MGTWENGKPHGRGEDRYPNGDVYIGEFSQGTRNGNGMMRYTVGTVYTG